MYILIWNTHLKKLLKNDNNFVVLDTFGLYIFPVTQPGIQAPFGTPSAIDLKQEQKHWTPYLMEMKKK